MKLQSLIKELHFDRDNFTICFVMAIVLISFMIYWFCIQSTSFKQYFEHQFKNNNPEFYKIVIGRYFGFLILGVVPIILVTIFTDLSIESIGLQFPIENIQVHLFWIVLLGSMAILINWQRRKNKQNLSKYPQIRTITWNKSLILKNMVSWVFYLIGYEILFRGILLFPLVFILGPIPAIAINVAFYSLTHFPKGFTESLGSIVLGTILCVLSLSTGTIYIAIIVHAILAISNFLISLKEHQKKGYSKLKTAVL